LHTQALETTPFVLAGVVISHRHPSPRRTCTSKNLIFNFNYSPGGF
jgi:hypothetical protein